jgi:tetratricopeptide (TPR) repeat protein
MRMLKKYELLDEYESSLEDELKDIKDDKIQRSKVLAKLALIKYEKDEFNEAIIRLNRAVAINEDDYSLRALYIHFMLSEERYWILGDRLVEWVKKYDRVSEHIALAQCRIEVNFLDKAREGLDAIKERVESDRLEYELLWTKYYKESGEPQKAKEILERLFEEYPEHIPVINMLSDLYNSLGEIDKSLEILENLGKDAVPILIRKIDTKKSISIEEIEKLKSYLDKIDHDDTKANINFGIANGYDKLKMYQEATPYLKKANELIYSNLNYSITDFRKEIDNIIGAYSREWIEGKQNHIKFDKRPIFIVGMPRSGTTMLEQIFAAHGDVFGAGELPYIQKIIRLSEKITKKDYPDSFLTASKDIIGSGGAYYIELTKKMYDFDEPIFVDKLPHNFMHSALLIAMFNDSKVIALRRDYRAIALSNYYQNFAAKKGTLGYAFDLEAMGEHIKDYIRIMDFYRDILPPDRYREFWYEDLVLNPKEKIPEVIEFCGLDFTPELLEFYKNKTAIKTASILQVREPIYTKSTQKWKHYEEMLRPLIDIVGEEGTYNG